MFAAPTATQTVQDPVQAQSLAEPGVFDAFDRSGQGVAQRRRAAIVAGGSVQRKVVQRELVASRGSGTLSGVGEGKLKQVMNTLNAMPFEEEIALTMITVDQSEGDPIVTTMPTESGEPVLFTIQTKFVESNSVQGILSKCLEQLGTVVLPGMKKADASQQVPKEEVFLAQGDRLAAEDKQEELKAKVFDFLLGTELLVAQLTKSKVADNPPELVQLMKSRLRRLRDEQGARHTWLADSRNESIEQAEVEKRLNERRAQ